jgi:hypothetical protein
MGRVVGWDGKSGVRGRVCDDEWCKGLAMLCPCTRRHVELTANENSHESQCSSFQADSYLCTLSHISLSLSTSIYLYLSLFLSNLFPAQTLRGEMRAWADAWITPLVALRHVWVEPLQAIISPHSTKQ